MRLLLSSLLFGCINSGVPNSELSTRRTHIPRDPGFTFIAVPEEIVMVQCEQYKLPIWLIKAPLYFRQISTLMDLIEAYDSNYWKKPFLAILAETDTTKSIVAIVVHNSSPEISDYYLAYDKRDKSLSEYFQNDKRIFTEDPMQPNVLRLTHHLFMIHELPKEYIKKTLDLFKPYSKQV